MQDTTKLNKISLIITHPGVFHADEVCAIAYLQSLGLAAPLERRVPSAEELQDPTVLILDIGGLNDSALLSFDHHQRGGAGARRTTECPYATFGLVYDWIRPADREVADRVEKRLVIPVDAADCCWGAREGTQLSFSSCVSGFNPPVGASPAQRMTAFLKAVAFATQVLQNAMAEAEEFVAARKAVLAAGTELGGKVLVLEHFAPWVEHVFDRPDQADLLYTIFPGERGGWCIQQVPLAAGSFEGRKPLPEAWAGLRGEELATAVGLSNHGASTFCHPGRFIGGAEDKAGVMAMAAAAVA